MTGSPPRRITGSALPWPLHGTAGTRALEAHALSQSPPHALMAHAGLATARLALAVRPHARRITVWAGPGNNGGDGLVAARHLHRLGLQVRVCHLADAARLPADAADALRQACEAGLSPEPQAPGLDDADLVIDALLGIGATRPPQGPIAAAIAAMAGQPAPVLAIDLPSGLHADTGTRLGDLAVEARWTLSLLTLKPGLFTAQGRDCAGEVWFDDLGAGGGPPCPPDAWLGAALSPPEGGFPERRHAQHKGSFGDVLVVGGAPGMGGAAALAAQAALAAGAGRVYLAALDDSASTPTALPEVMLRHRPWEVDPPLLQRATVVCGCGGGHEVAQALPAVLRHAGRLVLDADGLNAVAADTALQALLRERAGRGGATIITPHPLEAARLLGCSTAAVQADRLSAVRRLADSFGVTALIKGSGTVVAAPQQAPWINSSGNAGLAAPGSGDVLAGWIGGLWSARAHATDAAWLSACSAVWLHGRAADRACGDATPRLPLRAGALIDRMVQALG
jgi:hydroxyethylthiazole kinase-like uncharacterized protein yjeF